MHLPIQARLRLLLMLPIISMAACASQAPVTTAPAELDNGPASRRLVIAAVGDIMLDGSAREIMEREGYDHAFQATREWLTGADIAFGNLEGPLTSRGTPAADKKYLFRSPPEKVVDALSNAGFDVVSLANNHTLDYGADGLTDTILALEGRKIRFVGAGNSQDEARRAVYIQRNGLRVGFLAYSLTFPEEFWATATRGGTAFGHRRHIEEDIRTVSSEADIVVVSFHWGQESRTELRPYQVALGRAAIDAGASLVIGHHPHILQAVERYRGGVILYSLGNFAFGSYSQKAKTSALAEIEFRDAELVEVRMRPISVFNVKVLFQPTPLEGKAANEVVTELQALSSARRTQLRNAHGIAILSTDPKQIVTGKQ
jgi:poly-gamma-glutamate capsule biosynthesis protein CapA/YwtB (metallophosphatase superfamily)